MLGVVVVAAVSVLFASVGAYQYVVPEPTIEVFSPKGLRVSIPDAPDIKSVSFLLSFTQPLVDNDPGRVSKEVDDKEGAYWIYWNPNMQLKKNDAVHYKIIVNHRNELWSKQGTHVVDNVISLSDDSSSSAVDCEENAGQQVAMFPNLNNLDEKSLALTGGQKDLKSSYSMFKTMDTKPITRSSTTTTSGTFVIKPTGDIEGGGYKASSSYDSTRRDGEQWQHSKSELSSSDIDELKRVHGQGFMDFGGYPALHGSTGGSHSSYSSYSSSSSSSGGSQLGLRPSYGGSSSYFQSGQTADSMLPALRPTNIGSGGYKYSKYEEHKTSQVSPPVLSSAAKFSSSSDLGQVHIPVVAPEFPLDTAQYDVEHPQPAGYNTVQTNYHRKETVKTTGPVVTTVPVASVPLSANTYEYAPKPQKVVYPQPYSQTETAVYQGDIFRSSVRPTTPDSCEAADYGYKTAAQVDVVTIDRDIHKIRCLAVLAETSLRAEVKSLKQANGNLMSRLQELEEQFRRFRGFPRVPRVTWEEAVERVAAKRRKTLQQLRALAKNRAEYKKWVRLSPDAHKAQQGR